jgi:phosphatidate cytidylyltransferase
LNARARVSRLNNLQLRLSTAVIGLPVVVASVWIGGWLLAVVAGGIAVLAAAEFVHGWLIPSQPIVRVLSMAPAFAAAGIIVAGSHASDEFIVFGMIVSVILVVSGYLPTNSFGPRKPYRVMGWCLAYVGVLFATVVLTRDVANGREWVLLGLLSTFAVDTGAYATGKAFGRHKLAPRISPGKTREGAVGGWASGALAVLGLNVVLDTPATATTMLPFAMVMPILAQAGDLFESWMKRRMGVKDTSGLLPGHGGFLDRMDSILFVMPALYLFLRLRVL